jgi:hypothetical protein
VNTDEFSLYDAAYVLGALSPADRREFEDHLKVCGSCASSVSELAGLPGLMSRVSLDQLTQEAEPLPETLLPSLARAAGGERRKRRLAVGAVGAAAAAAACVLTVGAVGITKAESPARPPVASSVPSAQGTANMVMTAVAPSPVTASARLVDMAWGTAIELTCNYRTYGSYPAGGTPYAMVVIDRSGAVQQVATWNALPNRELTVTGATSRTRQDITAVEIRTLSGQTILRLST